MSTTAVLIIGITVIWLAQRALTVRQALRFRRDLLALRTYGKLSVGMSRKVGRRVYAGLTFDDAPAADRVVTAARTLRGATVFATAKPENRLVGCRAIDLAEGRTPAGLPAMVATAAIQSAEFALGRKPTPESKVQAKAKAAVASRREPVRAA
ncbi:hypothetical protein FDO65_00020 [Nakamurella flava]|uniref:Uncharacterized protein n=1 Tax=Nakamurella flava TaxID=2576308 RepID=A0A4U6QID5_9ACTN|nr:transcriptional regulator GutM [Nakamurella flava]TKV60164.1 hypothetical protein FDO65_00020 [Nakamurella flava]